MQQKHIVFPRQKFASWARNEYALLGTHCDTIRFFAKEIYEIIKEDFSVAYLDASHKESGFNCLFPEEWVEENGKFSIYGRVLTSSFQKQLQFQEVDLLLINGNHHAAQKQIVFLDSTKEKSIRKRISQLTNIQLFIAMDKTEPWDFLKELAPSAPVIQWKEFSVKTHLFSALLPPKPPLHALILAGGKSSRMGKDKSELLFHGASQWKYLHEILSPLTEKIYISRRSEQNNDFPGTSVLVDSILDAGPLGAILSAFRQYPNAAWLVIPVDMPGITPMSLQYIVNSRRTAYHATAFHNSDTGFPDPLFTIYEPKSYLGLLSTLGMGYSCPRKFLINSRVHTIQPLSAFDLININTPEDLQNWNNKTKGK